MHASHPKPTRFGESMKSRGLYLAAMSMLTGIVSGVIVTLYNIVAKLAEGFSADVYGMIRENPAFVPLLFVALFAGAFGIAVMIKLIPMIKGSGIPQTEGATRGILKFNWWKVLVCMSAASLFTIFMGMSAGSEGPSLQIGGACGNGVATTLRRGEVNRRYQITAGASAGLAVAFNAPLTGLMFAFEEAHRRFTPELFLCGFFSVASAVVTRNLVLSGFEAVGYGNGIASVFGNFDLAPAGIVTTPLAILGFVVLGALIASLLGVGFYKLCLFSRKTFAKIRFWKGMGKFVIPFLAAGVFGLITVNVMGGGHALIESLGTLGGTREMSVESIFGSPLVVTLVVVLVLKIVVTVLNLGCGVPCGIFIPMLAIGACIGALNVKMCAAMGMSSEFADVITMISMATFFTAVVKAPITAIVMVFELTWSFSALLPVVVGVAIGYLVSNLFGMEPLYERLLEMIVKEEKCEEGMTRETMKVRVLAHAEAVHRTVRDLMWPHNTVVVAILRNGERIVPESDTLILEGDTLILVGSTKDRQELAEAVYELTGDPDGDPKTLTPPEEPTSDDLGGRGTP